jgi:hypothetical protein
MPPKLKSVARPIPPPYSAAAPTVSRGLRGEPYPSSSSSLQELEEYTEDGGTIESDYESATTTTTTSTTGGEGEQPPIRDSNLRIPEYGGPRKTVEDPDDRRQFRGRTKKGNSREFTTGTVLFFRGEDWESEVIKFGTRSPWSHVGMCVNLSKGAKNELCNALSALNDYKKMAVKENARWGATKDKFGSPFAIEDSTGGFLDQMRSTSLYTKTARRRFLSFLCSASSSGIFFGECQHPVQITHSECEHPKSLFSFSHHFNDICWRTVEDSVKSSASFLTHTMSFVEAYFLLKNNTLNKVSETEAILQDPNHVSLSKSYKLDNDPVSSYMWESTTGDDYSCTCSLTGKADSGVKLTFLKERIRGYGGAIGFRSLKTLGNGGKKLASYAPSIKTIIQGIFCNILINQGKSYEETYDELVRSWFLDCCYFQPLWCGVRWSCCPGIYSSFVPFSSNQIDKTEDLQPEPISETELSSPPSRTEGTTEDYNHRENDHIQGEYKRYFCSELCMETILDVRLLYAMDLLMGELCEDQISHVGCFTTEDFLTYDDYVTHLFLLTLLLLEKSGASKYLKTIVPLLESFCNSMSPNAEEQKTQLNSDVPLPNQEYSAGKRAEKQQSINLDEGVISPFGRRTPSSRSSVIAPPIHFTTTSMTPGNLAKLNFQKTVGIYMTDLKIFQ